MKEEQTFWNWFGANACRIARAKSPIAEDLLDEVMDQLHRYNNGLYFEIGGHPDLPDRELIVTAEGKPELFAAVLQLCEVAPEIPGWKVIAFKQPMGFKFKIDVGAVQIDPAHAWFKCEISKNDSHQVDLTIAVPGYREENATDVAWACQLIIQSAIGERIATERISSVNPCEIPEDPQAEGFISLIFLADFLVTNYQ